MKRAWKPMLIVGAILLLAVAMLLPALTQMVTTEAISRIETPIELLAGRYCRLMLSGNLWAWLLVIGIVLIVVAFVLRNRKT